MGSPYYDAYVSSHGRLFDALRIPVDPLGWGVACAERLTDRAFVLVHADVHRKNLIRQHGTGNMHLLDWELALVADPVYDVAVHFHKMGYSEGQETLFLRAYSECATGVEPAQWVEEIAVYRRLEQAKSAIVDCVRYSQDLQDPALDDKARSEYGRRYYAKLRRAWEVWEEVGRTDLAAPRMLSDLLASIGAVGKPRP